MVDAVEKVVGPKGKEAWTFILWGLWESALRIEELMNTSWDIPGTIRPSWSEGELPVLEIPSHLHKERHGRRNPSSARV